MPTISGSEALLAVAFAVLAAVVGYALSEGDRRKLGRTPWGLPSLIWALFWFLSWVVGLVLFLIAHRAEVRRAAQGPTPTFDAYGHSMAAPPPRRSAGSDFPAYPRPADGGDRRGPPMPPAPPLPTPSAPAASPPHRPPVASEPPSPAASSPPSWQADPSGRYHYRWWTGTEWTSYVATHGHVVVDTSPDQRIGPY